MVRLVVLFCSDQKLTPIFLSFLHVFVTSDTESSIAEGLNSLPIPIACCGFIEGVEGKGIR